MIPSFADFLIGRAAGAAASGGNGTTFSNINSVRTTNGLSYRAFRNLDQSLFIADDWKVNPAFHPEVNAFIQKHSNNVGFVQKAQALQRNRAQYFAKMQALKKEKAEAVGKELEPPRLLIFAPADRVMRLASARALKVRKGSPGILLMQTMFDQDGAPFAVAHQHWRNDVAEFSVNVDFDEA